MRKRSTYIILITIVLAIYYLVSGIYLNRLGYFNSETLFYIEKARIIFDGVGNRLKVMGLTAPILPFYATFIFTSIDYVLAPVIASAIGTALLFNLMVNTLLRDSKDDFYLAILLAIFLFHPGMLYTAISGKGIYLILIFFYLFFLNLFKFYRSSTTFHISVASICLVILTFCEYKFIWLTLFFIPLVLSITINSLNLSERESIFRLFLSFNSPSLRRKLVNKTFALYMLIFILPVISVVCYKLLNLIHANDLNYFIESPYASWSVFVDNLNYNISTSTFSQKVPDMSVLLSAKILLYCPLILLALYLFKEHTYQILTILTPFALLEFLRVKYERSYLSHEFYLIFVILALLCIILKAQNFSNQKLFKIMLSSGVVIQLFTGYYALKHSQVEDERDFMSILLKPEVSTQQDDNRDLANYINSLPDDSRVMIDDAIAYPIVAFIHNTKKLIMPYQEKYLTAVEAPRDAVDYMLVATTKNPVSGYTQLNPLYLETVKANDASVSLKRIYEDDHWMLYRID
ncbi:hypothetical protein EOD41_13370 [Mucilaginibacter limnophilus]|uniref:Glycosyltransferase RgtA/B/C/D-like domain-containing protein n=1 Tax=Mucilaginibacter limnophilus TaxID=1932778 RepID=A0A437MS32_9SPHI|nr:hypothetical protein [Mucilaginibacter limnophilus]RVU00461.1 hypothetical protein EOD41_13370 [Mucilaginibacter limnophilus]